MNIAVIFAGGVGRRMNNSATPKQFLKLHGKEIIIYTLEKFNDCPEIDAITISCVEPWIPYLKQCITRYGITKVQKIVPGGKSGQDSIYNALLATQDFANPHSIVLIHDGVRPFIDRETIVKNIDSVKANGNAITVTSAIETIIKVTQDVKEPHVVDKILTREECCLARAPQSFYLKDIMEAHNNARKENKDDFIDSASLMQYYGKKLFTVKGPIENIKITTPSDYYAFKAYYEAKEDSQVFGL